MNDKAAAIRNILAIGERAKERLRHQRNQHRGRKHHQIPTERTRWPDEAFKVDPIKIEKGDTGEQR